MQRNGHDELLLRIKSKSTFGGLKVALRASGFPEILLERTKGGAVGASKKQKISPKEREARNKAWVDNEILAIATQGGDLGLTHIKTKEVMLYTLATAAYPNWKAAVETVTKGSVQVEIPALDVVTDRSIEKVAQQNGIENAVLGFNVISD